MRPDLYPTSQATITHTNRHEYTLVDFVPLQILCTLPRHLLLLVGYRIRMKWQVASPDRPLVGAQTIYNHVPLKEEEVTEYLQNDTFT